jgi:hypothetical protein
MLCMNISVRAGSPAPVNEGGGAGGGGALLVDTDMTNCWHSSPSCLDDFRQHFDFKLKTTLIPGK